MSTTYLKHYIYTITWFVRINIKNRMWILFFFNWTLRGIDCTYFAYVVTLRFRFSKDICKYFRYTIQIELPLQNGVSINFNPWKLFCFYILCYYLKRLFQISIHIFYMFILYFDNNNRLLRKQIYNLM